MESILAIYNVSTSLVTVYGYWKIANAAYDQYSKAKFLYDLTVEILVKMKQMIDNIKNENSKEFMEKLSDCISNMEYIERELKDNEGITRYYCSNDLTWEILYEKEISLEMNKVSDITNYYFPNIVSFYSYTDENGREITEF